MIQAFKLLLIAVLCLLTLPLAIRVEAFEAAKPATVPAWGVAAGLRSGTIVFDGQGRTSTSFVPLLYFQGEHVFLDGLEGGVQLYRGKRTRLSLLARVRFFDASKKVQNQLGGDTVDWGGQLRYQVSDNGWLDAEILSDPNGRLHGNLRYSLLLSSGALEINPYLNLRVKDAAFNSRYYALDWLGHESLNGSADLQLGSRFRYHVVSNLYLLANAEIGLLDDEVRSASVVKDQVAFSGFAGFGIFADHTKPRQKEKTLKPWIRLAQGFATPSSIGDILSGTIENDPENNQLTSIFYGFPLAEDIFGFPLELYLTPGFAYHHASRVQEAGSEFIVAVKAYYRFKWPVQVRLGLGTGFSWVSKITYLERSNNESKGYIPSDLLHYLDFSLDLNVGDLVRSQRMKRFWFGVGVHHRSAIFETAQQYGRIKGGSNYPMLYLQMDL